MGSRDACRVLPVDGLGGLLSRPVSLDGTQLGSLDAHPPPRWNRGSWPASHASPWPRITVGSCYRGPLQAVAIGLFLVNIVPMVPALPDPTRPAFVAAALCFFAGPRWRHVRHRTGDRCAPAIDTCRDQPLWLDRPVDLRCGLLSRAPVRWTALRWPRLATVQLSALVVGVALAAVAFAGAHTATDRRRFVLFARDGLRRLPAPRGPDCRHVSPEERWHFAALLLRPSR